MSDEDETINHLHIGCVVGRCTDIADRFLNVNLDDDQGSVVGFRISNRKCQHWGSCCQLELWISKIINGLILNRVCMKAILRNDNHKRKVLLLTDIFDACLESLMKNEIAGYQYTGLGEGLD